MANIFGNSFEYKLIYIFEINDEGHKGLLKIGDTTLQTQKSIDNLSPNCKELNQAALKRIKQYTNTAGLSPKLLHTELAIRTEKDKDGKTMLKAFRDHDVHRILQNSHIHKKKLKNSTSKEWFIVDLQTALKAIEAVKNNQPNLGNIKVDNFVPIIFRPEQEDAIEKTIKQFKSRNRMLWNAKMRFGKTLSALKVIKECDYEKTIIITHRPVVDAGWFEDFSKIFHGIDNYVYGSKNNGETIEHLLKSGKHFVYFASMQDLRGSSAVGGKFDKNDAIFMLNWDLVIVDEAHEGTTTALGDDVIKNIVKESNGNNTKFLALSGTPFNILNDYDENIYTWDYVMEQQRKKEWDEAHFGDSNPYDELPELKIYTYDLGKTISDRRYVELEDKAFNFREFFRVWTGDLKFDGIAIPGGSSVGDFYHESDVWSFLNVITKKDENSCYPYANEEYRQLFKHSLWMVPGVREAKALSKLMKKHPVFGSGVFDIINVAGDGDEEEKSEDALKKVREAINSAGDGYTITLSCGKLTTGVTVKEWTAVLMLAGSFSTSAANYLQTIFRVQSPCNIDGKIKKNCYVFDFAPDRTLKMVAESVALSTKAGKTKESDKRIMGEFLNYCPVISVDGTTMKKYDTNKLLQQLKRAYAERAVQNGFDDTNLYNDELLKLEEVDIEKFNKLKGIVGASKSAPKSKEIDINNQGFTDEEYEEIERIHKKPKSQRTPEEEEKLKKVSKQKKQKAKAISILRGISIRMPLLIYGADIDINEDITMNDLVNIVDDSSWDEFMPAGVTKDVFKSFIKYYDTEIFISAGRKIRNTVKSADRLPPTERIKKITELFSCFKNPDKETVLTPWRVVNMHMSDCLGGYDFYDTGHNKLIETPRYIEYKKVTEETFGNKNTQILEINSKTGLYPLYVTYSIFRSKCCSYKEDELNYDLQEKLWTETVQQNMFVICKTPMAKSITRRTLIGFKNISINAHYFDDLINMMKNKPKQFLERVLKPSYWKRKGTQEMKFDAIVGNPPYQVSDNGFGDSAKPIYNLFIEQSKALRPKYLSMIVPARWYSGGKGLDAFRKDMLSDDQLSIIHDFPDTSECFSNVNIRGGVCYFLWSKDKHDDCVVYNHQNNEVVSHMKRPLLEKDAETFIRYNKAISILRKVQAFNEPTMDLLVSSRKPFGLPTNFKDYVSEPTADKNIKIYRNGGVGFTSFDAIPKKDEYFDSIKVLVSKASPGADDYPHLVFSEPIIAEKGTACTETYLVVSTVSNTDQANHLKRYMATKFFRFLVLLVKNTQDVPKRVYAYVPQQNLNDEWNDEKLYSKYGITKEEVDFINTLVKDVVW
ncbi:DEAD/DEAH box helicase [Clostridium sporogenes]|uniref:Eco57I restriction-modification methylase domain-containing protein n=1 Tax=Clostridium sporogenes TaxID=1509 RepID=UPI0013D3F26D|nr:Eco57I restriction-modification methylase domain-containing protein [Clostridium sporogenes]NFL75060.1 DEAD/DEAH box helicase [Clostridium sporogenes]